MILYFSATGNCKYVATRIAAATEDQIISIADCARDDHYAFSLKKGERLGIVTPTYSWGLPVIVCDFLQKLEITFDGEPYVYFVATYGTSPGQTGCFANRYMTKKGLPIHARYSVKMSDTWTPMFDLSDPQEMQAIHAAEEPQIDEVIAHIQTAKQGSYMRHQLPYFAVLPFYKIGYDRMRRTKHFALEDSCTGCGICAKNCPDNALEMQEGKPVWRKEKCIMCLRCLHHCPKFAIQYGRNTKKHGQYKHPSVRV